MNILVMNNFSALKPIFSPYYTHFIDILARLYCCRVFNGCRECCKQSIRFTKSACTVWRWCRRTICRRHRSAVSTFPNVSDDFWKAICIQPTFCSVHIRVSRIYRSRGKYIQVGLFISCHRNFHFLPLPCYSFLLAFLDGAMT